MLAEEHLSRPSESETVRCNYNESVLISVSTTLLFQVGGNLTEIVADENILWNNLQYFKCLFVEANMVFHKFGLWHSCNSYNKVIRQVKVSDLNG